MFDIFPCLEVEGLKIIKSKVLDSAIKDTNGESSDFYIKLVSITPMEFVYITERKSEMFIANNSYQIIIDSSKHTKCVNYGELAFCIETAKEKYFVLLIGVSGVSIDGEKWIDFLFFTQMDIPKDSHHTILESLSSISDDYKISFIIANCAMHAYNHASLSNALSLLVSSIILKL